MSDVFVVEDDNASVLSYNEKIKMIRSVISMTHSIDLTYQNITDQKMKIFVLFYTPQMSLYIKLQSITELYLDNNDIYCSFTFLFDILQLNTIKRLSLFNNKLDDEGTIVLSKYLSNDIYISNYNYLANLEYLNIGQNYIGYEGAEALSNALKTHKYLIELDISDNNITSLGANYIGEMLKMTKSISYLNVNDNNINIYECSIFVNSISMNTTLTILNLGCNDFENPNQNDTDNENNITKIQEVIKLILSSTSIKNLVLDNCYIDDITTDYIANGLKENNTIQSIYLRNNEISNEGAYVLFNALKNNEITVLKNMDLSYSYIDNECIGSFAELLGCNNVLEIVNMYYTDINNEGLLELSKRPELEINESLIELTFGQDDIDEEIPIKNEYISSILDRNRHLYWHPCYYNTSLFNNGSHGNTHNIVQMIMSTLLCNTYGNFTYKLPMSVLIYIFKFFNRSQFIRL